MNNNTHPHQMTSPITSLAGDSSVRVSRRVVLKTGLGVVVLSTGIGTYFGLEKAFTKAAASGTDVVIQWNNAVLQAIRNVNPGPTIAARALAITHTCMYDAGLPMTSMPFQRSPMVFPKKAWQPSLICLPPSAMQPTRRSWTCFPRRQRFLIQ
jgi:hypothetical protein